MGETSEIWLSSRDRCWRVAQTRAVIGRRKPEGGMRDLSELRSGSNMEESEAQTRGELDSGVCFWREEERGS